MTRGSFADFLKFAAEHEQVQRDLVDLAAKHDFQFTSGELSTADLDRVTGGGSDILIVDPRMRQRTGSLEPDHG